MQGESIVSIELAVGAAALVLGARLISLIRATRGVPEVHRQVVVALSSRDPEALENETRGLGYLNPYGEVAGQVLRASEQDTSSPAEREQVLDRATGIAQRRIVRRTQQGQAADLVALSVAIGIVAFAREGLPAGPIFWALAGAVMLLLLFTLVARAQLRKTVVGSLAALRSVMVTRPQLPSLSGSPVQCFWCGQQTVKRSYDIVDVQTGARDRVLAAVCDECGKFVTTLPGDELDSSIEASSPVSSETS